MRFKSIYFGLPLGQLFFTIIYSILLRVMELIYLLAIGNLQQLVHFGNQLVESFHQMADLFHQLAELFHQLAELFHQPGGTVRSTD